MTNRVQVTRPLDTKWRGCIDSIRPPLECWPTGAAQPGPTPPTRPAMLLLWWQAAAPWRKSGTRPSGYTLYLPCTTRYGKPPVLVPSSIVAVLCSEPRRPLVSPQTRCRGHPSRRLRTWCWAQAMFDRLLPYAPAGAKWHRALGGAAQALRAVTAAARRVRRTAATPTALAVATTRQNIAINAEVCLGPCHQLPTDKIE